MSRLLPNLIETVRVRGGVAPLWPLHLRRLAMSCRALGIPLPGTLDVPEGGADRVRRFEVGATGVQLTERPVDAMPSVRLIVAEVIHVPYPHKTTDRAPFELAQREARSAGADDALLPSDGRGYVTEAAIWSLFWWEGTALCAPPLDLGILPGVARTRLLGLVGVIEERRVPPPYLVDRPLFVANAVRGVVPVATLGGRPVPTASDTAALASRFWPISPGFI